MSENWVAFIKPGEQVRAFRAYAVRVLAMLRGVEWAAQSGFGCLHCGTPKGERHASDCPLAVLIRETEEMLK